ncbi:MAG TPA: acyltransferase family protein [Nocardioides sp.]|nr:acyltransferase family protein [Nocardioides sp.]
MASSRDPWLDNAKMALVLLVVVGHSWALLPSDSTGHQLYDFLYLWHMPAFVLISGYLSRGFVYDGRRFWQLVRTLLVPYLVFEAALAAFRVYVGGEQLRDLWADPHFPLWYLLALCVWRLLVPIFRPLPGALLVAVGISLVGGFVGGDAARMLDLARILGFLPFFVVGLKATPERLAWLRGRFPAALGVVALGGLWVLAVNIDRWGETAYLYYRPYDILEAPVAPVVLTRLFVIAAGLVGALAFLALVPARDGWFARMGSATMIVYLFHGFAIKGAEYAGFKEWAADSPVLGLLAATVGAVSLALFLASPPVRRLLRPVVDPFEVAEKGLREAVDLTVVVHQELQTEQASEGVLAGR